MCALMRTRLDLVRTDQSGGQFVEGPEVFTETAVAELATLKVVLIRRSDRSTTGRVLPDPRP